MYVRIILFKNYLSTYVYYNNIIFEEVYSLLILLQMIPTVYLHNSSIINYKLNFAYKKVNVF